MARDLGVKFNATPTQSSQPSTGVSGLDSASATLMRSEAAKMNMLRNREAQAQQASQIANAPSTIAKETTKGTANQLFGGPIKALKSGIDFIGNKLTGTQAPTTYTGLSGEQEQTYQGELASGQSPLSVAGGAALDVASILPVGKLAKGGASLLKSVVPKATAEISKGMSALGKVTGVSKYLANRAEKKGIETVTNTIMPKPNAKEIKLALREGRIAPGRDPSLLRGGTPDEIMPSENTKKSAETIRQYIQGSEKMKAPELHTALGGQVKVMGTSLRPVMDATKITPKTVQKITKDWEALKAKQIADPYTPATANVKKLQSDFESNFLQKSKSGSFGDLWDTRIAYDASVPSGVKNATSLSSETLQTQKEIWLQNRRVLNDAINDAKNGLGDISSKTFSEMNDLYNAQKGIESSYKPSAEGATSKIKEFAKEHPFITGGALYGANEASKKTTGVGIPTPF